MNNETVGLIIGYVLAFLFKFVLGVVVSAILISQGLALMGVEISSNAIGFVILGLWLVYSVLRVSPIKQGGE